MCQNFIWIFYLGNLEHARVFLAAVALINCAVNVNVLVFWIRHTAPSNFNACRLNLGDINDDLKAVSVNLLVGGDFESLAHPQLSAMSMEGNVEQADFISRLGFQVVQSVCRQSPAANHSNFINLQISRHNLTCESKELPHKLFHSAPCTEAECRRRIE